MSSLLVLERAMEFGVIASAIGVIGVAAQTIEVITKVRSLVQEAKDAPSNIQNIAAELDILARTLSGIEMQVRQTNQPAFSDPSPALLYCQQGIEQIAVSVTQLQSDIARRKKRGLLRALWKKDELATHLARIERAKNSLMLAHSLYSSGLMLNKMDILSIAVAQSAQMLDVNNAAIASVLASRRPTPSQYNLAKLQTSPQTPDTSLLAGESHFNKDGQAFSSRKRASQPLNAMQTYMLRFHVSVWIWSRSWEVIVKQAVAGWDIRIRTCRVLPRDSEFFRACGRGDLSLVQNMFSSGKASPFDRDMDGLTGVHYFARGTLSPQAQLIMPAYEWLGFYKFLIESGSEITADHHENWYGLSILEIR
ncbi:hypothetical protein D6C97_02782 [Aureobasidium pullulans]|nr:hypothetical protein D6C97_02782 [Aureobasidium pullulans]